MKKQCEKLHSWGCKVFLSVALSSLAVVAHAQGADVCYGKSYTIASAMDASGATTYQWLENGRIISGAKAATYVVPSSNAVGIYTYIRQAKSEDCDEWQSSNEFTVTVYNCSFSAGTATGATATFIDPRDGKKYKTVVMPDGKTWFAQNLNYTKDLTFNTSSTEANGAPILDPGGEKAIGSYWCTGLPISYSSEEKACSVYGALYTWPTAMMIDGKYADETRTSSAWDGSWYMYTATTATLQFALVDRNQGRGPETAKQGGRGICPMGWHVPTPFEWATLFDAVSLSPIHTSSNVYGLWIGDIGPALRSDAYPTTPIVTADGSWLTSEYEPTNTTGFSAMPAGVRDGDMEWLHFDWVGRRAVFWASASCSAHCGYAVTLAYDQLGSRSSVGHSGNGYSIRCLAD